VLVSFCEARKQLGVTRAVIKDLVRLGSLTAIATEPHGAMKVEQADVQRLGSTCRDCGELFFTDDAEHDWYLARGLKPPARCRACRRARRT
jgi:hypothetical protein